MTEGKKTIQMIIMVIGLTVSSRFLGFFRDVLISSRFGTSLESDAYFMALKITAIVFMSIGSAITTTMIPTIVDYITKGEKQKAFNFANKILTLLFLLAMIVIPLGILGAPIYTKYIAFGFEPKKIALTASLVRIMFPIFLCTLITYIFVSILQSFGNFSITSILSVPYNILLILYLTVFVGGYGIKGLAFATVLGWMAQFAVQIPYLFKKEYRLKFILDGKDPDIQGFFKLIFPILLAAMVYNINNIVDSSLASTLSEGKLSALNYGFIVYTAIASTTIYGISTVLFPKFAQNTSLNDYGHFKEQVSGTIKVLSFILIPMTIGLITLRTPIVKLAFERGAFDQQAVVYTKVALTYYALGMMGFGMQEVLNKSFFALKDTKTPMKFGIMSVLINIILNIILIKKLDLAGLALATSLATIVNGVFLYRALTKKIGKMDTKNILISFGKVLTASAVMSVLVFGTYRILNNIIGMDTFITKLILLMGSISIGIVGYGITTMLLRVEEAQYVVDHYLVKWMWWKNNG